MITITHRLAFVQPIDQEEFALYARSKGWYQIKVEQNPNEFDEDRPAQCWGIPGNEMYFVDDTIIQVQYIDIPGIDSVDSVKKLINVELGCFNIQDCLKALNLNEQERTVCRMLRLLACIAAPCTFDNQVFEAAVLAMQDCRPNVRIDAITIAHYTKWVEFLPEVSRLASVDSSPDVRQWAGSIRFELELVAQIG